MSFDVTKGIVSFCVAEGVGIAKGIISFDVAQGIVCYRSLLPNIVSFIGLFCKRDL